MNEQNTTAARDFYKAVRGFSESAKPWATNAIFYETKPDECFDLSLVSQRVYGRRDEFFAVMAAAGLSVFDQELRQQRLVLPNEFALMRIKKRTGFESIASLRSDCSPVWVED